MRRIHKSAGGRRQSISPVWPQTLVHEILRAARRCAVCTRRGGNLSSRSLGSVANRASSHSPSGSDAVAVRIVLAPASTATGSDNFLEFMTTSPEAVRVVEPPKKRFRGAGVRVLALRAGYRGASCRADRSAEARPCGSVHRLRDVRLVACVQVGVVEALRMRLGIEHCSTGQECKVVDVALARSPAAFVVLAAKDCDDLGFADADATREASRGTDLDVDVFAT